MIGETDKALFNLQKVKLWQKNLNEADTRAKIIDVILKECLGWTEADIIREDRIEDGFVDYILSVDGIRRLVVEAKRSGEYFNVPIQMRSRKYKISASISKEKNIITAIEQAQRYCTEKGANYGVVTNGDQFIIFEAFLNGEEWRHRDCIVYRSIKDVEEHFTDFWNTLSKNAVRLNSLHRALREGKGIIHYRRPLDRVHNSDEKLLRNHLAGIISPFIGYIFEEITDDSKLDILKNCYIYNKSYQATDEQIRSFFEDQMPPQAEKCKIEKILEGKDSAGKFQVNFYKCADFLREEGAGSFSVLLGGVGSGKTTFLHRFFKVVLYPEEKVLWFYIDFRTAPTDLKDIRSFLIERIAKHYETTYAEGLKEQLENLDLHKTENSMEWLTKLFTVLKMLGFTLSLVIDNVDQHYQLYPDMQQKVFLEAQRLTDSLKTITILSLREESFFKHGLSGVFGAYYISSFHVTSPNFGEMIQSRINYLLDVLKLPEVEIGRRVKMRRSLLAKEKQDLIAFFEIIRDSFKSRKQRPKYVMRFIESITGSNMRKGLEMFNLFLISGNTKVREMLDHYRLYGAYQIAYHHVMKSIVLGESKYYAATRSYVMNIFDINPEIAGSHFLHLKILRYARDRISYDSGFGRGYVSIDKLKSEGEKVSVSREAIDDSLKTMARFGLVVFNNQDPEGIERANSYRITLAGNYYLEELSCRFVYQDLVWMDTPIGDESIERGLRYVIEENDMAKRFERTEKFLDYLEEMERADFEVNPFFNDSELGKHKFMERILMGFKKDKDYIESRLTYKGNA